MQFYMSELHFLARGAQKNITDLPVLMIQFEMSCLCMMIVLMTNKEKLSNDGLVKILAYLLKSP